MAIDVNGKKQKQGKCEQMRRQWRWMKPWEGREWENMPWKNRNQVSSKL